MIIIHKTIKQQNIMGINYKHDQLNYNTTPVPKLLLIYSQAGLKLVKFTLAIP